MKSEDQVQQEIVLDAPKCSAILWRNNSGALPDARGVPVRYGLANLSKKQNENFKSSDEIGITTITITPDMVGKAIGVFTAVEVKEESWKYSGEKREVAQKAFIDFVIAKGGFAGFAKSVEDFRKIIGK